MYLWNKPDGEVNSSKSDSLPLSATFPFARIRSFLQDLCDRIPLTLQGTLTFLLSSYLLIHGLTNRNAYEILLGTVFALLLSILLGIGYLVRRGSALLAPTWQVPGPATALGIDTYLTKSADGSAAVLHPPIHDIPQDSLHRIGGIPKVPLFFRVHFEIKGTLRVGDRARFSYSADWAEGVEAQEIRGAIPFALGGQFHGVGSRTLRDIFGMVRLRLPPVLHRNFAVLPAPSRKQIQLRLDPSLGLEEKRTLRSADEERYFMREYAPGDRFRDINWKTSSRLAFLVTRIAPQAQEKTRTLSVAFRCFGPSRPDLVALWTLDRCKAWLFQFLWTVRKEHPEFIIRVTTPLLEQELTTDQETERFCEEIAGYGYGPQEQEGKFASFISIPEEVFVFATTYDRGLSRFVGNRFDLPTHLYVTIPLQRFFLNGPFNRNGPRGDANPVSIPPRSSNLSVTHCLRTGGIVLPHLLLPNPIPSVSVPRPLRGTLETEYTEVTL